MQHALRMANLNYNIGYSLESHVVLRFLYHIYTDKLQMMANNNPAMLFKLDLKICLRITNSLR